MLFQTRVVSIYTWETVHFIHTPHFSSSRLSSISSDQTDDDKEAESSDSKRKNTDSKLKKLDLAVLRRSSAPEVKHVDPTPVENSTFPRRKPTMTPRPSLSNIFDIGSPPLISPEMNQNGAKVRFSQDDTVISSLERSNSFSGEILQDEPPKRTSRKPSPIFASAFFAPMRKLSEMLGPNQGGGSTNSIPDMILEEGDEDDVMETTPLMDKAMKNRRRDGVVFDAPPLISQETADEEESSNPFSRPISAPAIIKIRHVYIDQSAALR